MASVDKNFNLEFFEKLLDIGKYNEAIKLIYDMFDNIADIQKMLAYLSAFYLEDKQYDRALVILKELIQLNPEDEGSRYNLGLVYFFKDQFQEAVGVFESLIKGEKFADKVFPYLIYSYICIGKYEDALKFFESERFLNLEDELIEMLMTKLIDVGKYVIVRDIYEKLLNKGKKSYNILYGLGVVNSLLNDFEKAKNYFEMGLEYFEKNLDNYSYIYMGLGIACLQIGDYKNALKNFEKSIEKKLNVSDALLYSGRVYYKLGNVKMAIEKINEAGNLNSSDPEIWKAIGDIYYEMNDISNAKINYKKSYLLRQDSFLAFMVGLFDIVENNFEEAYEYLKKAILDNSLKTSIKEEILKQLVLACYYVKKYEEALNYARELLEKGIREERLFLIVSNSLTNLNLFKEAEEILEFAIKSFPKSAKLFYSLGMVKNTLLKFEEADKFFNKALDLERNSEFLYAAALTKIQVNDKLSAVKLFCEAKDYYKDDKKMLYKIALHLLEIGEKKVAKSVFLRLLELDPDNREVKDYLKKM